MQSGLPGGELPTLRVLQRGWLSSNNIVFFDDDQHASIVDTGYSSHREQTLALVNSVIGPRRLTRIVNTHLHSDHCGGNALLAAETGARIAIPPGLATAVAEWDEDRLTFRSTGQHCDPFRYDALIDPGTTLRLGQCDWEVIAAPGHDPHSIVLWNAEDRVLISADALWQHGFGAIFPEIEGESGFAEQAELLHRITGLAPRLVIPGHGAPFMDVEAALTRAYTRLEALVSDPVRNARHVAKALLKFYLLEVRSLPFSALVQRLSAARYFQVINERYFAIAFDELLARLVRELVQSGVAAWADGIVSNRDA